jgi:hypothetical protein
MLRRFLIKTTALLPLVITGCAVTPKDFYNDPSEVKDTTLCRTFLEAAQAGNSQFAADTGTEAVRRGLTLEQCQTKVSTENAILAGMAVAATGAAVVAACSGGGCAAPAYQPYSSPYGSDVDCSGGGGNGPRYVTGPFRLTEPDIYGLDADHDGIACEPYQDLGS